MKILWIKAGKLLPVNKGSRIRSYYILRQLARHHEVTLLSYYGGRSDPSYESEIKQHLRGAVAVNTEVPDETIIQRGFHYLRHLSSPTPFSIAKFTDPEVQSLLGNWFRERRFDVAVCDFLSASLNFPRDLSTPTVLFQHNVEGQLWRRQAQVQPIGLKKIVFKIEAAKMFRYEQDAVRKFHHVIAVSEQDRIQMSAMTDSSRITVVPTGVDVEQFRTASDFALRQPLVLFTGDMNWEPNIDGVNYFCREIWPRVLTQVPDAHFRIVGRDPHRSVRSLACGSVEVTGTVPSVIDHLKEARVFVVPLRMGGGTRLKIYEAMAAGKPVVSTTVGAEGLDVRDGRDILLADDASTFADSVVNLLQDDALCRRCGKAAIELAARHDWSVIAEQFADVLERVVKRTLGTQQGDLNVPSWGSVRA